MAIQDIIEKIKSGANAQAKTLKADNASEISKVEETSAKAVKAVEGKAIDLAKKKYDEEKRLKISLATLELKNKLLAAKQDLINNAFEKALVEVKALPDKKYKKLLIKAILNIDLQGNEGVILGGQDFEKFGDTLVADINTALAKDGRKGELTLLDERREGVTGCVLKDGRTETICTFESIIANKRKELEKEVVSILF